MLILKTFYAALAAATLMTGFGFTLAKAGPATLTRGDFVNQPGAPFRCRTDDGYGRWGSCDNN